eukprot:TRINITY_DN54833_c0_g1_i1.p1 TRINITY_DN54833_c0_g1~~TRINITY_DN54833_c0_g1_i1.p1  ORF type:complete len:240 (+),score=34.06 TRINITY_DN54833_c0_g1_i1:78-797(+)
MVCCNVMTQRVVFLGDSIGASQGVPPGSGFVSLVSKELKPFGVVVDNWSRGGVTVTGYMRNLSEVQNQLKRFADASSLFVIIELGGNDRIIGVAPAQIQASLMKLVLSVQALPARALIMEVIPDGIERDVSAQCGVALIPTPSCIAETMQKPLRRGVIPEMDPSYVQRDGIHPNTRAQGPIAHSVLTVLSREMGISPECLNEDSVVLGAEDPVTFRAACCHSNCSRGSSFEGDLGCQLL